MVYSGTSVGTVISTATAGIICDSLGWEAVFYISAISGMVWFVFWQWLVHDSPEVHPSISEAERDLILVSLGKKNVFGPDHQFVSHERKCPPVPWTQILNSRAVWALAICCMGQAFSGYLLLTEVPTFLSTILQFQISEVAYFTIFSSKRGMHFQFLKTFFTSTSNACHSAK